MFFYEQRNSVFLCTFLRTFVIWWWRDNDDEDEDDGDTPNRMYLGSIRGAQQEAPYILYSIRLLLGLLMLSIQQRAQYKMPHVKEADESVLQIRPLLADRAMSMLLLQWVHSRWESVGVLSSLSSPVNSTSRRQCCGTTEQHVHRQCDGLHGQTDDVRLLSEGTSSCIIFVHYLIIITIIIKEKKIIIIMIVVVVVVVVIGYVNL